MDTSMEKQTAYHIKYDFFKTNPEEVNNQLGSEELKHALKEMLLIRHFEIRAESAYQQWKV